MAAHWGEIERGKNYEIMKTVPESYLEDKQKKQARVDGKKQVILSCYLKAEENK